MIEEHQYVETVKDYFNFLITEFGFRIVEEKIRGNVFYDLWYMDRTRILSISYENIEDYFQIVIFLLQDGELPDYDDQAKTLHLNHLVSKVISKVDRNEVNLNNEFFIKFSAKDEFERKLLKSAKELRLCLKYFNVLNLVD